LHYYLERKSSNVFTIFSLFKIIFPPTMHCNTLLLSLPMKKGKKKEINRTLKLHKIQEHQLRLLEIK
jgi:hypothetical protein